MAIFDFLFKGKIDQEVVKRVTEVEQRMVEVSDQKVQEKARELTAQWQEQLRKAQETAEAKSLLRDPFQLLETLKYKERPMMLTYEVLRSMSERNPIIAAIINTRVNQVSAFSSPPKSPYDVGFQIVLKNRKEKPDKNDETRMEEIQNMVSNTGVSSLLQEERDNFDTYLRKVTRDSLTYDQMAYEIINGRGNYPVAFLAIDASSIRLATTARYFKDIMGLRGFAAPPKIETDMGSIQKESLRPEDIRYVQIIDSRVMTTYTEQELGFGIRNPRTALRQNGYGVSELEILVNTVTAHLWAEEYNRRAFCLSLRNYCRTKAGVFQLKDLIGKTFEVWNGRDWAKARAFATGIRPLVRTKLWNGLELETSPEHKFYVIPKDTVTGEPEWKEQKDLQPGDYALLSCQDCDFPMNYDLLKVGKLYGEPKKVSVWVEPHTKEQKDQAVKHNGHFQTIGNQYSKTLSRIEVRPYTQILKSKTIEVSGYEMNFTPYDRGKQWIPTKEVVEDPEFWKMIGFALGDGYWGKSSLPIAPNPYREYDITERFSSVCQKYNIQHTKSSEGICIRHKGVLEWLYDLGFVSTEDSKKDDRCIPPVFFRLPSWIRCALLSGLFSADGTNEGYRWAGTPSFGVKGVRFRLSVLKCLWSVGVASNQRGSGWRIEHGGILVQDVAAFARKIGFLQTDPKSIKSRDNLVRSESSKSRWDRLHPTLSKILANKIYDEHRKYSTNGSNQYEKKGIGNSPLSKRDGWLIVGASCGGHKLSRPRAIGMLESLGLEVPEWLRTFMQTPVDVLDKEPIGYEPMGDIEVFDDKHLFLANFVAVHNSQGSAPKGIIQLEGNVPQDQLNEFRRQWHAQIMGVFNAWRTPIINTPSGKLNYVDLSRSNKQMEYSNWIDYLIKIACAVYLIDPSEIGFDMRGGAQTAQPPVFESHGESKQKMSRDKGLRPLLRFLQTEVNKDIVYRVYDGRYEFEFVGLDAKTEEQLQEMRLKEVQNFKTIDEIRAEYDLKPLGHDMGGDVIMNSAYLSYLNQLAMQKMQEGQGGGPGGGEDFGQEEGAEGEEQPDFGEEMTQGEEK